MLSQLAYSTVSQCDTSIPGIVMCMQLDLAMLAHADWLQLCAGAPITKRLFRSCVQVAAVQQACPGAVAAFYMAYLQEQAADEATADQGSALATAAALPSTRASTQLSEGTAVPQITFLYRHAAHGLRCMCVQSSLGGVSR